MRRLATLLLLLLVAAPARADRDPDYDRVVEAYKKKRYADVVRLAPQVLAETPDYVYAHTVRYVRAEALRQLERYEEARAAYEDYLRLHPDRTYAERIRASIVVCLHEEERHEEAIARADEYLKEYPEGEQRDRVKFWRARSIEDLRRFEEAAAALADVGGKYAERAAFRLGVVRFRSREFDKARASIESFLAKYPGSSWERVARDYLFRTDADYSRVRLGIVRDYAGKYENDPRLREVRKRLPKLRAAALRELEEVLDREVARSALIRLKDAGTDRSGLVAATELQVVDGEPREVLTLYTEYLVTRSHDLSRTIVHELFHCAHRESLGEDYFRLPKWAREGAAVYVAGQADERFRILAANEGRRRGVEDPLDNLVNGLEGRHTFDDYAEDASAFLAVEKLYGRKRAVKLVRRLLTTADTRAAVSEVLGVDFAAFEREAAEYARERLAPLVGNGRRELLRALAKMGSGDWDEGLAALPADPGVYSAATQYYRALALLETDRPKEALEAARRYQEESRWFSPLLDDAIYLEIRARKALGDQGLGNQGLGNQGLGNQGLGNQGSGNQGSGDPGFPAAAERAKKDLEPTSRYEALLKLLSS